MIDNAGRAGKTVENICEISTNCNVTCSSGKVMAVLSIIEAQIEVSPHCCACKLSTYCKQVKSL
jgi:hypothetical protein